MKLDITYDLKESHITHLSSPNLIQMTSFDMLPIEAVSECRGYAVKLSQLHIAEAPCQVLSLYRTNAQSSCNIFRLPC